MHSWMAVRVPVAGGAAHMCVWNKLYSYTIIFALFHYRFGFGMLFFSPVVLVLLSLFAIYGYVVSATIYIILWRWSFTFLMWRNQTITFWLNGFFELIVQYSLLCRMHGEILKCMSIVDGLASSQKFANTWLKAAQSSSKERKCLHISNAFHKSHSSARPTVPNHIT